MEGQNYKENHHHNDHQVVVVMVPFPAQGHLNQHLHLSHIITSYNIPVHFACSATHNHQAKLRLHGRSTKTTTCSSNKIHFHDFELPSLPLLLEAATHLRQPVHNLVTKLAETFRRVVVIHSIVMAYVVQDVKLIPNAEAYTLNSVSAFNLFLSSWESLPNEEKEKHFQSLLINPQDIPEYIPSRQGCVVDPKILELTVNQLKVLGFESGCIHNTSRVVEGRYVQLLEKMSKSNVKHFALGPFNPVNVVKNSTTIRHECLKWLDEQEKDSVIYVAFGSTTSFSEDQIKELANGLERSMVKFLWVCKDVWEEYDERVKGRGMVVRDWAPQLEILEHSSVGGFMSHCGWNSCMESISMAVPMAAWPMQYDQPKNAALICDVLRIGKVVRGWAQRDEIVTSNMVEEAVKMLMVSQEGREMRERVANLSQLVRESLAQGGGSYLERDAFIAHITRF